MRFHPFYVIFSIIFLTGCSTTTPTNVMNEHGFQRFQPPHKGIEPGTLVILEDIDEKAVAVTPVCWRQQAFPTLLAPKSNPAVEAEFRGEIADSFDLEAAYLERAQAKYPEIDEIEVRLANPSVLEYSDIALYEGIPSRSKVCLDAVAAREANGQTVYTILRVLKADVTYEVIGKDRTRYVRGKLPQKVLERIKTQIGGSTISAYDQTIKGNALHWGLKPDIIAFESFPDSGSGETPNPELDPAAETSASEVAATDASAPEVAVVESPEPSAGTGEESASDNVSAGRLKAPRLSDEQRRAIIQKVAILKDVKSDADRLK